MPKEGLDPSIYEVLTCRSLRKTLQVKYCTGTCNIKTQ